MAPLHYGAIDAILRSFVVDGNAARVTWGSGKVETVQLDGVATLKDVDCIEGGTMRAWVATGDDTVLCVHVNQRDGWSYMGSVNAEGKIVMNPPLRRDTREEDLARCTDFC